MIILKQYKIAANVASCTLRGFLDGPPLWADQIMTYTAGKNFKKSHDEEAGVVVCVCVCVCVCKNAVS